MNRRILIPIVLLGLLAGLTTYSGSAQDAMFATSKAIPTQGPREIMPGVTFEPITTMGGPGRDFDFTVGLQRITIEPGAVFDLVPILGYGYAGPVQFYVERGVMTVTPVDGRSFGYTSNGEMNIRRKPDGDVDVPADVAVYVMDGNIGPVRNNGDELLVILAIIIVPDQIGSLESDYDEEIGVSVVATPEEIGSSESCLTFSRRETGTQIRRSRFPSLRTHVILTRERSAR